MRNIPFGRPIIGDEEKSAVMDVLSGPILVHGPRAKDFEAAFAEYVDAPFAVSVSSCTAAMHLYYFHLGLGPGDEVVVPAQTHVATAHAVELTGAKPVFADADPLTGNIDTELLEAAITGRTRAISLVHYLGLPADMDAIMAIANKHGLPVLEDCALAIGSKYKGVHAGLVGDCGCFSFYPVKHMTTAEGGMFICRDAELAEKITKKKAFGVDRVVGERKVPGVYDVNMLGFNYRMNEMQAALGIEQVKRMDGFLEAREANDAALRAGLNQIDEVTTLDAGDADRISSRYCMTAILDADLTEKRFEIVKYLNENGVGTSVYYPKPVPHMAYYKEKYGHTEDSFPQAARISYQSIALPVGPHLDVEDMEYIVDTFKKAINEVK